MLSIVTSIWARSGRAAARASSDLDAKQAAPRVADLDRAPAELAQRWAHRGPIRARAVRLTPRTIGERRIRLVGRMRARRYRELSLATLALCIGSGCRTPTQVTVELATDVACDDDPGTTVQVGRLGADLETRPPS